MGEVKPASTSITCCHAEAGRDWLRRNDLLLDGNQSARRIAVRATAEMARSANELLAPRVSVGSAIQTFPGFPYQTRHTLALGFTIGALALHPNA